MENKKRMYIVIYGKKVKWLNQIEGISEFITKYKKCMIQIPEVI